MHFWYQSYSNYITVEGIAVLQNVTLQTVTSNHFVISGLDLIWFILSSTQEIDLCTQEIDSFTHHMLLTAVLCQSNSDSQRCNNYLII